MGKDASLKTLARGYISARRCCGPGWLTWILLSFFGQLKSEGPIRGAPTFSLPRCRSSAFLYGTKKSFSLFLVYLSLSLWTASIGVQHLTTRGDGGALRLRSSWTLLWGHFFFLFIFFALSVLPSDWIRHVALCVNVIHARLGQCPAAST